MEGNRDDAERCLEVARAALSTGDISKAERLLEKSLRMYPLRAAQTELRAAIRVALRKSQPSTQPERNATEEMTSSVKSVSNSQNHYEALGVSRGATSADIKRAYRKLALQLHPDKNCAHGAAEAFQKVSDAFACLSDSRRRAVYDAHGSEDVLTNTDRNLQRGMRQRRGYARGTPVFRDEFEMDVDAEELFEYMFAAAARAQQQHHQRRARRAAAEQQRQGEMHSMGNAQQSLFSLGSFYFNPLIILTAIAFALLLFSGDTAPDFSIDRHGEYVVQMDARAGLKYFVTEKRISRGFPLAVRKRLQYQAEREWFERLKTLCAEEQRTESALWNQVHGWMWKWLLPETHRQEAKRQLDTFQKPACEKGRLLAQLIF